MNALEVIRHENPYCKPLGQYIEYAQLPMALASDPLSGLASETLTEFDRRMLRKASKYRFEPTVASINVASTVQDMLWRSAMYRNPLLQSSRVRRMRILEQRGRSESEVPWLPESADGFMLKGCTGTGKTTVMSRYLSLINQTWEHGPLEEAGWTHHVQVTYLIVKMQTHRKALLHEILTALDAVLGTSYREMYMGTKWTIEKLAIEVAIILVQHGVGMLVFEEIQARNFSMAPDREQMLLFILRVLNFGIPVVLVGNPVGFAGLDDFSQDINRLTENEPIHLMPVAEDDPDWRDGIGRAFWEHAVVPEQTPWDLEISKELYACSAGFPGFARKAVDAAQEAALRSGAPAITIGHLRAYRESLAFAQVRNLVEGFIERNPFKLMQYLDVPWQEYGRQWGKITAEDVASSTSTATRMSYGVASDRERKSLRLVHERLRQRAAAEVSGKAASMAASKAAAEAVHGEDRRRAREAAAASAMSPRIDALRERCRKGPGAANGGEGQGKL